MWCCYGNVALKQHKHSMKLNELNKVLIKYSVRKYSYSYYLCKTSHCPYNVLCNASLNNGVMLRTHSYVFLEGEVIS